MPKASPMVRSFNSGEFSALMEGRTDLDKYPASLRKMFNTIAAPSGPAIGRSGTEFINENYDANAKSLLVPFVFSETDFYAIEFAEQRIRFFTEDGILTKTPVAIIVTADEPFTFKSNTLNAEVGDQIALGGFDPNLNLDGVVGNILSKNNIAGEDFYTIDTIWPYGTEIGYVPLADGTAALVYSIASPYLTEDLENVFDLQSLDVIYLYHPDYPTRKLSRYDTYDWRFSDVVYVDGPYLPTNETKTTLALDITGKATPNMTDNTNPQGQCTGSGNHAGSDFYMAFDDPTLDTYWRSDTDQAGTITYQFTEGTVVDGYSIAVATNNTDTSYTSKDFAPSTWYFEGTLDGGTTWIVIDRQTDYVLYDSSKSVFFKIPNTTPYVHYRLRVTACTRNGAVQPSLRSLIMRIPDTIITLTANQLDNINNGAGFQATDVGRLLRIKGSDSFWRPLVITEVDSTTVIKAKLLGEPFPDILPCQDWRLGVYSDTTGYPNCAEFYEDRLWNGGSKLFPDILAASETGSYESHSPTDSDGTVLDTNGICIRLNSRKLSLIKWLAATKEGLLLGTGSEERLVRSAENSGKVVSPSNVKADPVSKRGSAAVRPLPIDQQVLFTQRGARTIREAAYSYETDNVKTPSMTQLASHLGIIPFTQMVYAAEPHSIVWCRRTDGSVVGLTYNRDEDVVGWHRHDFGGEVESMIVLPATDQRQDTLWMIIKRDIGGVTKRYIEKLTRFWDFDMTIDDAWYLDCALRFHSDEPDPNQLPIDFVGLEHLEGEEVYALADGVVYGPFTVTVGTIRIPQGSRNVLIGKGFDSYGETSRLENGAADGTSMGKTKRVNNISAMVWASYGGSFGVWNNDTQEVEWFDINDMIPGVPVEDQSVVAQAELFTGIIGPFVPDGNYEKEGSISFRRNKNVPLPLNIVAIMPQMNTQDR